MYTTDPSWGRWYDEFPLKCLIRVLPLIHPKWWMGHFRHQYRTENVKVMIHAYEPILDYICFFWFFRHNGIILLRLTPVFGVSSGKIETNVLHPSTLPWWRDTGLHGCTSQLDRRKENIVFVDFIDAPPMQPSNCMPHHDPYFSFSKLFTLCLLSSSRSYDTITTTTFPTSITFYIFNGRASSLMKVWHQQNVIKRNRRVTNSKCYHLG